MKFIVDAQLPKSLSVFLNKKGHDAIHTLDLVHKNASSDIEINKISLEEERVVISKDSDFFDRFFQRLEPYKLLYLTTGNMHNKQLLAIFENNYDRIIDQIEIHFVVEVSRTSIITIH